MNLYLNLFHLRRMPFRWLLVTSFREDLLHLLLQRPPFRLGEAAEVEHPCYDPNACEQEEGAADGDGLVERDEGHGHGGVHQPVDGHPQAGTLCS